MDPHDLLRSARTVLLIDWPSRAVPDTLARAGFAVVSADGPDVYNAYELVDGEVQTRQVERPPESADVVYAYRPLDELGEIVELASELSARVVWMDHLDGGGSGQARAAIESAGMALVTDVSIVEAAAAVAADRTPKRA